MTQRIAFLCHDVDAAKEVVGRLYRQNFAEDDIHVVTNLRQRNTAQRGGRYCVKDH